MVASGLAAIKQYGSGRAAIFLLLPPGSVSTRSNLAAPLAPASALGASLRIVLKGAALAAVLTVPMFLWNPGAFMKDIFWFQIRQPFRSDALSYLAWFAQRSGMQLGSWVGFVAVLPALVLGALRAPRTPAGFAAASGLVFLAFFAFNKQAFCNFCFFMVACCSPPSASYRLQIPLEGGARRRRARAGFESSQFAQPPRRRQRAALQKRTGCDPKWSVAGTRNRFAIAREAPTAPADRRRCLLPNCQPPSVAVGCAATR